MDTNVLSCSKCGHTVSESAEACAYCGTAVSSGDALPPPDEETPEIPAPAVEPPLMPEDDSASKTDIPDAAADAEPSNQIQPEEKMTDTIEPAAEAKKGLDDQLSDSDDQIDFQLPDEELIVELDTAEVAKEPEAAAGKEPEFDTTSAPVSGPDLPSDLDKIVDLEQQAAEATAEATAEVIPLADKVSAKTASNDAPGLPETPVLDLSGEDKPESETLGAEILELVQDEASEQESAKAQASETVKTLDEPAIEKSAESAPDETPDSSENNDGDLAAKLLAPADENQPISGDVLEAVETGASEKPVELAAEAVVDQTKSDDSSEVVQTLAAGKASIEAMKIEKASQELAEAQKKQKVALARAKALKIKKLKLAKAQALKKKKLKLAKAKALQKQKAAQAGTEKSNNEVAAGSRSRESDNADRIIQPMDTNTKMLGLLKKYEGQAIGINYDNSAAIKEAQLVEANDEFFSVFVKDKELNYTHPLKTILTIIEGKDGVETGESDQKEKFTAVVKVYPLVLF